MKELYRPAGKALSDTRHKGFVTYGTSVMWAYGVRLHPLCGVHATPLGVASGGLAAPPKKGLHAQVCSLRRLLGGDLIGWALQRDRRCLHHIGVVNDR